MSPEGSVSRWLGPLKEGSENAVQQLWQRYFHRLVGLARQRLQSTPRRATDEEDVALSAFASFCRGAEQGRFPKLHDRDDLWRLLVVLTARKAGRVLRSAHQEPGGPEPVFEELVSSEPTPAFAAEVADECRRLLRRLEDAQLEVVALAKMEGYTNAEIAEHLDCSLRTVERKLDLIRTAWREEGTP